MRHDVNLPNVRCAELGKKIYFIELHSEKKRPSWRSAIDRRYRQPIAPRVPGIKFHSLELWRGLSQVSLSKTPRPVSILPTSKFTRLSRRILIRPAIILTSAGGSGNPAASLRAGSRPKRPPASRRRFLAVLSGNYRQAFTRNFTKSDSVRRSRPRVDPHRNRRGHGGGQPRYDLGSSLGGRKSCTGVWRFGTGPRGGH
jgi:hypothetical protein